MFHPTNNKSLIQKAFWHLKILAGAILITIFFSLVFNQKIVHSQTIQMLVLSFLQLEIFVWLGARFFQSLKVGESGFKKKMIIRLFLFYFVVLLIAFSFYIMLYAYFFIKNGSDFTYFFSNLFNNEMKGFFTATLVGFTLGALIFFYVQWAEALKR